MRNVTTTLVQCGALFILAFALVGSSMTKSVAQAYSVQYPASICMAVGNATVNGSYQVIPASGSVALYCPMVATDTFLHSDVNYASVEVYDNSASNIYGYACVKWWDQAGGSCSANAASTSGTPGSTSLIFDRSGSNELDQWVAANNGDYPFFYISLPNTATAAYGMYMGS